MELRVLKYFLMVSREENITKAAQLLHVTQPALSRQLMQLEEELGVKLFERSSHSIVLTNDGMLLKRRAQEIVELAEKTKKELSEEKELSGEFKSFSFFADIISEFNEKNPNVSFKFYSGNGDLIKSKLERGILDVGLLSDPVDISRYEFIRFPIKEVWGVFVHEDFEIAKKDFVMPEDLIGIPMLMPHRRLVQDEIKNWFGDLFDEINVFAVYDLLYNSAVMVRKKMGVMLSIELESKFDGLKFIPLSPKREFGSVMVWKKNQVYSAAASAFIEYVKKYIKDISDNTI